MRTVFWHTERTAAGVSLMTESGGRNGHRIAEYEGLLGSRKEKSWSREKHMHTCCGAKQAYRHHIDCPDRTDNLAKKRRDGKL
ncbi:MAG TPA: hypothetical protein VLH38_03355 [Patescibacteria group bacterium]|nr:hypothetical protein [Patescibacteria group bacterium]